MHTLGISHTMRRHSPAAQIRCPQVRPPSSVSPRDERIEPDLLPSAHMGSIMRKRAMRMTHSNGGREFRDTWRQAFVPMACHE